MRRSFEQGFAELVAPGACSGLFTVTRKNLEAFTEETGGKDGEACVAALLGLIVDSQPTGFKECADLWIVATQVTEH